MKKPAKTTDHNGNTFSSITAMCIDYAIPRSTYRDRIKRGWSQERALTLPPGVKTMNHYFVRREMNNGMSAEIVFCRDPKKIIVEFANGEYGEGSLEEFYAGRITHPHIKVDCESDVWWLDALSCMKRQV